MRLVYIAGQYSAPTYRETQHNVQAARDLGLEYLKAGYAIYIPHTMIAHCEDEVSYGAYMAQCFEVIRRCDVIALLPGWEDSPGAVREKEKAEEYGLDVHEHFSKDPGYPFARQRKYAAPQDVYPPLGIKDFA